MGADLRERQIRDNVFVWTLGGEEISTSYGANCAAVVGDGAALLVDPLIAPAHARLVEEALRAKTSAPVRFVVLTHHHTDHALGSAHFASNGAIVVAHAACAKRMAAEHAALIESRRHDPALAQLFADAESPAPSVTFDQVLGLNVGGVEVEILHPGPGHTAGDAVVFLPRESVAVCGDLVSSGYHVNYEDAFLADLETGLAALESLGASAVIPGHGEPGGAELIGEQRRYHAEVSQIVREGAADGEGDAAMAEEIGARFPDYLLRPVLPDTARRLRAHLRSGF